MRLTCPACQAQYAAPEGAVADGQFVRCSACRAEWRVGGGAAKPPPRAAMTARQVPAVSGAAAPPPVEGPDRAVSPSTPAKAQPQARQSRAAEMAASLEDAEPTKERRGGFIAGFALTAGLCLIAIALYARHEAIATAAPQTADALARYVAFVDMARERLADLIAMARDRLAAML